MRESFGSAQHSDLLGIGPGADLPQKLFEDLVSLLPPADQMQFWIDAQPPRRRAVRTGVLAVTFEVSEALRAQYQPGSVCDSLRVTSVGTEHERSAAHVEAGGAKRQTARVDSLLPIPQQP